MEEIDLKDLFFVFWKRRKIIILIAVTLTVAALIFSLILPRSYKSQTAVDLGDFKQAAFNDPLIARQAILSDDLLLQVIETAKLDSLTPGLLRKQLSITAVDKTNVIYITAAATSSETARSIVSSLAESFMQKSSVAYKAKVDPINRLLSELYRQSSQVQASIDRNKAALTSVETNGGLSETDKDITRARLLDYISRDESYSQQLATQIKVSEMDLTGYREAAYISKAGDLESAFIKKVVIYTGAALIFGLFLGMSTAFVLEIVRKDSKPFKESK
jgi:capsular polysaccharide biosynthesis protein